MLTHAEYIAAYPLPALIGTLIPAPVAEPPVGIGRVHRIWRSEEDMHAKALTTDDYIGALSKDEWRDAWHVATLLNVTQEAARCRLVRRALESITERRTVDGRYEWRLL